MDIKQLKERVRKDVEPQLKDRPCVLFDSFEKDGQRLHVYLTERLRKKAVKAKLWLTKELLSALKNGSYGFNREQQRSPGGSDGLFLLDRDFPDRSGMVRQIFDQYLDKPDSGVTEVASELGTSANELLRLVSHHLRILGVLKTGEPDDHLVLVDVNNSKNH